MQATITKTSYTGKVASNRKEKNFTEQLTVVTIRPDEMVMRDTIQARFYHTGSRVYCCVWIHAKDCHTAGGGFAAGGGYHRKSAALESALNDAGITLSESVHGVGDAAMVDALQAVAFALGFTMYTVFEAHA
jgi:hypothetical protein